MSTTTLTPTSANSETPKIVKKGTTGDLKNPSIPTQTTYGCKHIKGLLQQARQPAIDGYSRVLQSIRKNAGISNAIHKTGSGTSTTGKITYLCLQCPHVNSTGERHRKEHVFAVESENGFILCHDCRDFVYDPTFEDFRASASPNAKKRKHSAIASEPGERRLVTSNSSAKPCAATGLRGLYNMGQTCFMSVILQSLIHNPFIRAFYLSEGHKSSECEREACTSCALDDIFMDFYKEEKHEGYGAVNMLQGCWKGGGGLAGYSQQDAHEYLGFILNSLHTANTEDDDDAPVSRKDPKNCDCVIHQTFGGVLRSTVTCSVCKNTTTTLDPFTDLSLDIRSAAVTIKKKKLSLINGTTTVKEVLPMDLTECLDRFTSPETLSADSYTCRKCDKAQEAEKRLRLHSLPPVLPVHLKRFSHSKTLAQSSKVDTKIRFSFTLDLAPYTAGPKQKQKQNEQSNRTSRSDAQNDVDKGTAHPEPTYVLSSVIVHKGKIDNGHYISYSRQDDEWFRFDDSMVVQVNEKEVLGAEAYMLFYVVREFDV